MEVAIAVAVALVAILVVLAILVLFGPANVIKKYLIHKPYGMQTLFDRVTIETITVYQVDSISFCIVSSCGVIFRLDKLRNRRCSRLVRIL